MQELECGGHAAAVFRTAAMPRSFGSDGMAVAGEEAAAWPPQSSYSLRKSSFDRMNALRSSEMYGRWLLYVCSSASFRLCTVGVSGYVAHEYARMRDGGESGRSGMRTSFVAIWPECTR